MLGEALIEKARKASRLFFGLVTSRGSLRHSSYVQFFKEPCLRIRTNLRNRDVSLFISRTGTGTLFRRAGVRLQYLIFRVRSRRIPLIYHVNSEERRISYLMFGLETSKKA